MPRFSVISVAVALSGVVLLAAPLVALFSLVVVAAAGVSSAVAVNESMFSPSDEAIADIPGGLITLYIEASATCPGLPWQVLAAIGKIESNHGRHGGATLRVDGRVVPPITGIPLNGANGTASIPDTDDGFYDGDTFWDRAVGPMQFIPSSWRIFGADGNSDGVSDPHNYFDAAYAAVRHLCPTGTVTNIEQALLRYNRSAAYVSEVLEWAARYVDRLVIPGEYAYPLPAEFASEANATRSHHDYPALDVGTPVGTPVFAMIDGTISTAVANAGIYRAGGPGRCGNTIVLVGDDGATFTYCHMSAVTVVAGQSVAAGELIGLTGGEPDAAGAGNTTGPHLHLAVRFNGRAVCPQPLMLGILRGHQIPPSIAPVTGCYHPGPSTDWSAWLNQSPSKLAHEGEQNAR